MHKAFEIDAEIARDLRPAHPLRKRHRIVSVVRVCQGCLAHRAVKFALPPIWRSREFHNQVTSKKRMAPIWFLKPDGTAQL
jgi:hypothetical protein